MAHATRTFRIFVSSTFNDLTEERNALQKEVFPGLRKLCERYGTRFQAIDLRWGVRDEASLDQQTVRICLEEIERCRRASPRPNFIILLGDRYGWRPVPSEIPADEFEAILSRLPPDPAERERRRAQLARWYGRDDNAVPAVYCLLPRQDEFEDPGTWDTVERDLRTTLLDAVAELPLSDAQRVRYVTSATEQEIERGAMQVDDAGQHVFGFFRTIRGLPGDRSTRDFRDLDAHDRPDERARGQLEALKARLRSRLADNIYEYGAEWRGLAAGQAPSPITTDHVAKQCADVYAVLSRVIQAEIDQLRPVGSLEKEIDDHTSFRADRSRLFVGRTAILDEIARYVAGTDAHPLALFGESGTGKSAVIARAVERARAARAGAEVVERFLGATPSSSDARSLLESLCRQVSRAYGADAASVPTDYRELVQEFPKRLDLATASKPLIVFLDALDQLSDADRGRNLVWLPAQLPDHVRLVVSTLAPGECLAALERKLPATQLLKLVPMPVSEAGQLLDAWLRDEQRPLNERRARTLQSPQRAEVLDKFAAAGGLPLYLKLASEEARRWKSYTALQPLSPTVEGIIGDLFERLASPANHGAGLVSRSLAYLAAAKNGLSEDELLDTLSSDETVLGDFMARARHTPPEPKLPVVVWSRLYQDLEPYLSERSADNASLLAFYHRQLRAVVERLFLAGAERTDRHRLLARYFGTQDLFDAERKTPNVRKLSELPYQQTHGALWEELYKTLTDFDFLEAKCTHVAVVTQGTGETARTIYGGVYELQEDYRLALERFPSV